MQDYMDDISFPSTTSAPPVPPVSQSGSGYADSTGSQQIGSTINLQRPEGYKASQSASYDNSSAYNSANSSTGYTGGSSYNSANSSTGYTGSSAYNSANSSTGYTGGSSYNSANSSTGYTGGSSYNSANSSTGYTGGSSYNSANSSAGYTGSSAYNSANSSTGYTSGSSAPGYGSRPSTDYGSSSAYDSSSSFSMPASSGYELADIVKGLIGALIGALPGFLLWILVGRIGVVAAACGAVLAAGSYKGYSIATKNVLIPEEKGLLVCFVVVLIAVFFAEKISWCWTIADGTGFSFGYIYSNFGELLELANSKGSFILSLIISYAFAIGGGAGIFFKTK